MDTLTSITVFRQVVDSGGFVRAARRLEMSTAAVSKHVMHVEQRLGVRLLNRNSRSVSLTEPGKLYFDRCKTILEDLQATELELGSLSSVPRGTLRVSVPSLASGRWLADLLAQYRCRYPEVLVDLSFEDRLVNLVEEGYDLALRITSSQQSLPAGLVARPLRPAVFCLAASREYVKRHGAPSCPEDLPEHDFVEVGDMLNTLLRPAVAETQEIPLHVVLRYRSMDGVADAVAAGIGIAPVPDVLFDDPAFRDVLTPILREFPLQPATLYVIYATRKFMAPKLRTFVDLAIECVSLDGKPKRPLFRAIKPVSGATCARAADSRVGGKPLASLIVGRRHARVDASGGAFDDR